MKITLIDRNTDIVLAWKKYFAKSEDVEIVNENLKDYLDEHINEIDAIVSPANSFGLMDGGYDKAIIMYFGDELQYVVQQCIKENYHGEQVVGTSFSIEIPNSNKILIHTPTMRVPSKIKDPSIVYSCMRSTLLEAQARKVKCILIPAFGGLTGRLRADTIALNMFGAFCQMTIPVPDKITWDVVLDYTSDRFWSGK